MEISIKTTGPDFENLTEGALDRGMERLIKRKYGDTAEIVSGGIEDGKILVSVGKD